MKLVIVYPPAMAACSECGSRVRSGSAFCPSCGTPAGWSRGSESSGSADVESVQMLSDVTGRGAPSTEAGKSASITASAEITTSSSSRRLFGIGVVVLILALGWSVLSGSGSAEGESGKDADDPASDQTSSEGEPADQEMASPSDNGDGPDGTTQSQAGNMSIDRGSEDSEAVEDLEGIGFSHTILDMDGQPVEASIFGNSGFALYLHTDEGHFLADPQSGESIALTSDLRTVHLVTETHILGQTVSGIVAIPLGDPQTLPVDLDFSFEESDIRSTHLPHQIWVVNWQRDERAETLYDLGTGEALVATEQDMTQLLVQSIGNTSLVNTLGSGVFERVGSEFRFFASGWGMAANKDEVLVHRCDDTLTCRNLWLDRESGETLEYPTPGISEDSLWGLEASEDGRWLLGFDDGPLVISEIETGRELDLERFQIPRGSPGIHRGFDLSPDGSWLAYARGTGDAVLINLDTETQYRLSTAGNVLEVHLFPLSALG